MASFEQPASCITSRCVFSASEISASLSASSTLQGISIVETINELEGRGVGFRSLTENIDTTTPGGRLVFHLFGALAQFERDLIRERTWAGLKAAEDRRRHGGRQAVITPDKLEKARQHMASGLNLREAAAQIKVGKTALYAALKTEKTGAKHQA
ncbi:MAG TPA: recombinase family protein [Xanthomonadaceae bacterium]|nr:recombinase family protein [Xanthomonadaceae bacterium]